MLIDVRVYTYQPSLFRTFLTAYEERGFPLTTKHLGTTLGIFTTASGIANQTVQMFAYESAAHRDQCRVGLLKDQAWLEFTRSVSPMIVRQENTLLTSVAASELRQVAQIPKLAEAAAARKVAGSPPLLFEWRCLTVRPGRLDKALAMLGQAGTTPAPPAVETPVGLFEADTGIANRIFALSAFSSAAERAERRNAARAEPNARAFERVMGDLCSEQSCTLLAPTPYSPLR